MEKKAASEKEVQKKVEVQKTKKKGVIRRILLKFWFRKKAGAGLEAKLGYDFKDPSLLAHALVHRSWLAGRDMPYWENNERLEFLGDSVLNMLVTEYLYSTYPHSPEGDLSKYKSAIVSGHALAKSAQDWDLGSYMRIGKCEVKAGGRSKESLLEDAFEAVIGAVYLDGGLDKCRKLLQKSHFPHIKSIIEGSEFKNFKSLLLEFRQARNQTPPEYAVVEESGPEHQKTFKMIVLLDGSEYGTGAGVSKKKAEQEAAHVALDRLVKEDAEKAAEKAAAKAAKVAAKAKTTAESAPAKPETAAPVKNPSAKASVKPDAVPPAAAKA